MTLPSELSRKYYVTPGLCNARRELPLPRLVSDIIEIATDHANRLGIGFRYMTPKGLGWVLSRLSVEMRRYPRFNEHYILTTWVEGWNRHFSVRDFMVATEEGVVLGYARTVWMVIDLNTHTNAGTGVLPFDTSLISGRECPMAPMARQPRLEPETVNSYTFRYTDIDFYSHVNTVRYVELLLNQFPLDLYEKARIGRMDISFRHEAHYAQTATVEIASPEPDTYAVCLRRDDDILIESQIRFSGCESADKPES